MKPGESEYTPEELSEAREILLKHFKAFHENNGRGPRFEEIGNPYQYNSHKGLLWSILPSFKEIRRLFGGDSNSGTYTCVMEAAGYVPFPATEKDTVKTASPPKKVLKKPEPTVPEPKQPEPVAPVLTPEEVAKKSAEANAVVPLRRKPGWGEAQPATKKPDSN
ncbi:MAG: hypothetical protein WCJ29_00155 [bacterium]